MLFFGVTQRQFLAVNKVFHNIFCHIKSGTGHIIIASALSCIDLKELELAVSSVVFDIEIGKSHIMQFFEQIFDTHHQFLIRLCDNDCMIAQSVRCMLFKKHMTEAHHFHLAVVIRIGCQHTHILMGCRTRVFENRFGPKTSIGRGNISFSTINIVRLAIECMDIADKEQRIALFFAKLDAMLDITARQLHERMEFQKTAFAKQFPLLMSALWIGCDKLKPNEDISSVINQGTLGIGFIGLAECLVALLGKHHGESEEAQELGLKIVTYMRDRANQFSDQYQHNYSVLATPAEGLSGKFTRVDRKKFGCLPGITDRDYYTNSNHVPVYYKCSARHKAEVEAPYHDLTRGGHIFYVEIDGDATHNPEVIMRVVDMMDRYNIGYGSVNHNRNRCLECGYENSTPDLEVCPKCGSTHIDKLQRITGYLVGTTDRWNQAKLAELNDRVVHGN